MPQDDPHDLMPWYVAGSLEADEAAAFRIHVAACRACSEEEPVLRALKETIATHGEALFLPHPDAALIVAEGMEGLAGPSGEDVRRHLFLCPTCALESRLVRGEPPSPAACSGWLEPLRRAARHPLLPWLAAAASLLVAAGVVARRADFNPLRTEVLQAYYVEPPQRSSVPSLVEIPKDTRLFQLVLPVDLPATATPLSLEIQNGAGRTIFSRGDIRSIYRDAFLFVVCDARQFPEGDYLARIRASARPGAPAPAPLDLAFRIAKK